MRPSPLLRIVGVETDPADCDDMFGIEGAKQNLPGPIEAQASIAPLLGQASQEKVPVSLSVGNQRREHGFVEDDGAMRGVMAAMPPRARTHPRTSRG
jgi:hypothetical protein